MNFDSTSADFLIEICSMLGIFNGQICLKSTRHQGLPFLRENVEKAINKKTQGSSPSLHGEGEERRKSLLIATDQLG